MSIHELFSIICKKRINKNILIKMIWRSRNYTVVLVKNKCYTNRRGIYFLYNEKNKIVHVGKIV